MTLQGLGPFLATKTSLEMSMLSADTTRHLASAARVLVVWAAGKQSEWRILCSLLNTNMQVETQLVTRRTQCACELMLSPQMSEESTSLLTFSIVVV